MYYLAQVNIGVTPVTLIGLAYILLSVVYFFFMIAWLIPRFNRLNPSATTMYILQIIFIPIPILISGFILVFQGWRLDPILQFGNFLIFLVLMYLLIKDITINVISRNRP
jgi:Ycf66 protein N-terminus